MNQSCPDTQVLAWEIQDGISFQYSADGKIYIEEDQYIRPQQKNLPGQVIFPVSNLDALERFITKVKAIQSGEVVSAPALYIAS